MGFAFEHAPLRTSDERFKAAWTRSSGGWALGTGSGCRAQPMGASSSAPLAADRVRLAVCAPSSRSSCAQARALLLTASLTVARQIYHVPRLRDCALAHEQLLDGHEKREVRTRRCLRARFGLVCWLLASLGQRHTAWSATWKCLAYRQPEPSRGPIKLTRPVGPRPGVTATRDLS